MTIIYFNKIKKKKFYKRISEKSLMIKFEKLYKLLNYSETKKNFLNNN